MKRFSIFAILVTIIAASSCVKDRLQPATPVVVISASDTLMYYWSFNGADSSVRTADVAIHNGAFYSYYASYIDFTTGSGLNLRDGADSGSSLRLRNPYDSVIFHMPTTGYDSISVEFAAEASGSGPSQSAIYYTTDGVNYISTALGNNTFAIGTTFAAYSYSFASDANVKNNPKFAIKIVPLNNNTGTSGNDRIDNVSMSGVKQ